MINDILCEIKFMNDIFRKTNLNQSLRVKYWQKGKLSVRIVAKVHFYLKVGTTKCNKANARIEQVFSNAEYAAKNIIYYNFFRCRALFLCVVNI